MQGRQMTNFLTTHAVRRMSQRAVTPSALQLALRCGQKIQQNGATVYFLGRRHLPDWVAPTEVSRLEGTVAVVSREGAIITTFRSRRLPRHLRLRRARRCRQG